MDSKTRCIEGIQRTTRWALNWTSWFAFYLTFLLIMLAWNNLTLDQAHAVTGYFIGFSFGMFAHEMVALLTGQTSEIHRYANYILEAYKAKRSQANAPDLAGLRSPGLMAALLAFILVTMVVGLCQTIWFQLYTSYNFNLTAFTLIGATAAGEVAMPYLSMIQTRRGELRTAQLQQPNVE